VPTGVVTFERVNRAPVDWSKSDCPLAELRVIADGRLEDSDAPDVAMVRGARKRA